MNTNLIDYNLSDNNLQLINNWNNNKDKPLLITGDIGIGKTFLANILLKKHHIITITEINYDTITSFIKESINQCDIFMMINKGIKYKALLIDDLHHLIKLNKKNIKKLIYYLLNEHDYQKVPVIIINNMNTNKIIDMVKNKSYILPLKISYKLVLDIINKHMINKQKNIIYISNIPSIVTTYKNIHIIKQNIDNLQGHTSTNDIYYNDIYYNDILSITREILLDNIKFEDLFRFIDYDYKSISLNILDNSIKIIPNNDITTINTLYKNICISDNFDFKYIKYTESIKYIIFYFSCIYPVYKQLIMNKSIKLNYTNYISTSILQVYNKKIIYTSEISNKISPMYYLWLLDVYNILKYNYILIELHKFTFETNILEKQLKIYNYFYNKNITKNKLLSMLDLLK